MFLQSVINVDNEDVGNYHQLFKNDDDYNYGNHDKDVTIKCIYLLR